MVPARSDRRPSASSVPVPHRSGGGRKTFHATFHADARDADLAMPEREFS